VELANDAATAEDKEFVKILGKLGRYATAGYKVELQMIKALYNLVKSKKCPSNLNKNFHKWIMSYLEQDEDQGEIITKIFEQKDRAAIVTLSDEIDLKEPEQQLASNSDDEDEYENSNQKIYDILQYDYRFSNFTTYSFESDELPEDKEQLTQQEISNRFI
jgi:hypothetical protein